jgi:hypothetical protein
MPLKFRWALAAALLFATACHRKDKVRVETDEGPPHPSMFVSVSDPKTAPQLLDGFYGLEGNSWRWTAGHFSVLLGAPPVAARNGGVLKLDMTIPKPLIDLVKTTTLTVRIHGEKLPPESITQPGSFTFVRDVPPSLFDGDPVKVEFSLDRYIPAGKVDTRELGLIVSSISMEPSKTAPGAP